ncbi:MAG: hypothetical protein ABJM17_19580 [Rhizobiaceae bacterium]
MRYSDYVGEPNCASSPRDDYCDEQIVARENLLRIAEILTLLGFLHTPRYFAEFHLGLGPKHVEWFVRGNLRVIQPHTVRHLREKLSWIHEVLAQEVANATDTDELWLAQARYNLLQTAIACLN